MPHQKLKFKTENVGKDTFNNQKIQELANIGIMAMEISHELRNLLQTPLTFIDLIPQKLNDQDFLTNFRKRALDRLKVISDKLYDIMYFGKERPPNFTPDVDVNKLLDSIMLDYNYKVQGENIEVVREYSYIPTIKADINQLTHLFNNLIINAGDAMKEKGGKLRIRTGVNNNLTDEMKNRSLQWLRVEIKDDGIGIPQQVLKRLFTPFITTKNLSNLAKSGTGLGMCVVKKVVDAHRGYIFINTKEGKGTTVIVNLPVDLKLPFVAS